MGGVEEFLFAKQRVILKNIKILSRLKKTDNNNQLLIKKMITEIKLKAASLYPIFRL